MFRILFRDKEKKKIYVEDIYYPFACNQRFYDNEKYKNKLEIVGVACREEVVLKARNDTALLKTASFL